MVIARSACFIFLLLYAPALISAQAGTPTRPVSTPSPPPKLSATLRQRLENLPSEFQITRERREQGFVSLLQAQRFILKGLSSRSQAVVMSNAELARNSLLTAVDSDPRLAEAYTALAELTTATPPNDVDDAIGLASIATSIDKSKFGFHRIIGRRSKIKRLFDNGRLHVRFSDLAISQW